MVSWRAAARTSLRSGAPGSTVRPRKAIARWSAPALPNGMARMLAVARSSRSRMLSSSGLDRIGGGREHLDLAKRHDREFVEASGPAQRLDHDVRGGRRWRRPASGPGRRGRALPCDRARAAVYRVGPPRSVARASRGTARRARPARASTSGPERNRRAWSGRSRRRGRVRRTPRWRRVPPGRRRGRRSSRASRAGTWGSATRRRRSGSRGVPMPPLK